MVHNNNDIGTKWRHVANVVPVVSDDSYSDSLSMFVLQRSDSDIADWRPRATSVIGSLADHVLSLSSSSSFRCCSAYADVDVDVDLLIAIINIKSGDLDDDRDCLADNACVLTRRNRRQAELSQLVCLLILAKLGKLRRLHRIPHGIEQPARTIAFRHFIASGVQAL